jgi:SP family sugar:H+ symporter-like MFS transporter
MKDWLRTFGHPNDNTRNHVSGYYITSSEESLVVSSLSAGTFFGKLSSFYIPARR